MRLSLLPALSGLVALSCINSNQALVSNRTANPQVALSSAQFGLRDGVPHLDSATGFKLTTWEVPERDTKGGLQFGYALPQAKGKDEYIGKIVGSRIKGSGWSAIGHDAGMAFNVLLVAWADGDAIRTSFRFAEAYNPPVPYDGKAKITQLGHTVNSTHFTLTYKCQDCFSWSWKGKAGNQTTDGGVLLFSWAQGSTAPANPGNPESPITFHENGFGVLPTNPKQARNPNYEQYAAKAPSS